MAQDERIKTLHEKHAELEANIAEEEGRPMPDTAVLQDLKRQKLAIKDELAALSS